MTWNIKSTSGVPAQDRTAFWEHAVRSAVLDPHAVVDRTNTIEGRITTRVTGDLRCVLVDVSSSRDLVCRQAQSDGPDQLRITLQLDGSLKLSKPGQLVELRPGDIAVVSARSPFESITSQNCRRAIIVVPGSIANPRFSKQEMDGLVKLSGSTPYLNLARSHVDALMSPTLQSSYLNIQILVENLCNLLFLEMRQRQINSPTFVHVVSVDAVSSYQTANLTNPDLCPDVVARHFGVSVRTVHKAFEGSGTTFGKRLLRERLRACKEALSDPVLASRSITDLAFERGFNDAAHFSRAFKNAFGVTPREWRRSAFEAMSSSVEVMRDSA